MGEGVGEADRLINLQQDVCDPHRRHPTIKIENQFLCVLGNVCGQPVDPQRSIFNAAMGNSPIASGTRQPLQAVRKTGFAISQPGLRVKKELPVWRSPAPRSTVQGPALDHRIGGNDPAICLPIGKHRGDGTGPRLPINDCRFHLARGDGVAISNLAEGRCVGRGQYAHRADGFAAKINGSATGAAFSFRHRNIRGAYRRNR